MKTFSLPSDIHGIVFDIDSTLYRNDEYVLHQYTALVGRLSEGLGLSFEEGTERIEAYRRNFAASNGGRYPSLGNTSAAFGFPVPVSVSWREELIQPEEYLSRDAELGSVLALLSVGRPLAALTNNPASIALRTLRCLGVEGFFAGCIGLDDTMRSKPDPAPFHAAADLLDLPFTQLLFVGDRFEVDLEYPLSRGAGGVLVSSMEDIYRLPEIL
jgi:phosphoglycolate phosphatase/putative hydrolase of the HAD superfamily